HLHLVAQPRRVKEERAVVGRRRFVQRVRGEELLAIARQDQTAVVGRARSRALHFDRVLDSRRWREARRIEDRKAQFVADIVQTRDLGRREWLPFQQKGGHPV